MNIRLRNPEVRDRYFLVKEMIDGTARFSYERDRQEFGYTDSLISHATSPELRRVVYSSPLMSSEEQMILASRVRTLDGKPLRDILPNLLEVITDLEADRDSGGEK